MLVLVSTTKLIGFPIGSIQEAVPCAAYTKHNKINNVFFITLVFSAKVALHSSGTKFYEV
jgi:hypothetical protein